jgi:hypothetical protein
MLKACVYFAEGMQLLESSELYFFGLAVADPAIISYGFSF